MRYARFNSSLVRKALGLVYKDGRVYPILFGPTRGMKVRFHPGMNYHALLGLWERESSDAVIRVMKDLLKHQHSPLIVADVGANLGMYSLLLSHLLANQGEVHAFEPAPPILDTLQANIALNHLTNVTVTPKACADHNGTVTFFVGWHHHTSSLDGEWAGGETGEAQAVEVQCTTLDNYFDAAGKGYPHFVKMDIEGGAVQALEGCHATASQARSIFYIESHTPDEDRAISNFALAHQYRAYRLSDQKWVNRLNATHPDPEGIWGNLFLIPAESETGYFD